MENGELYIRQQSYQLARTVEQGWMIQRDNNEEIWWKTVNYRLTRIGMIYYVRRCAEHMDLYENNEILWVLIIHLKIKSQTAGVEIFFSSMNERSTHGSF